MDVDDLFQARAAAFGSVFMIVQHLTRRADQALADLGITTRQWLLLALLTKAFSDHSPSLSEAAEKYGSSRQNVKQIALGLEARGFVRLVPDATDGRTTRIELTERVRLFDEPPMVDRTSAMLDDVFAGLTAHEIRDLRDLSHRWLDGLATSSSRLEPLA
jgi:DNA-binding MarR family transcriptional regulator